MKENMKRIISELPIVGFIIKMIYRALFKHRRFPGSEEYWIKRYDAGGDSGAGSYDELAEFKAEIVNNFVEKNHIETIIEYGCGDGNQLMLSNYPSYIGFDVSPNAILRCKKLFQYDESKSFKLISEYNDESAQLTISLDVLYHLTEDDVYHSYMDRLFSSANSYVIIYSSNYEDSQSYHEKRRRFTDWIDQNADSWKLKSCIPNKYPYISESKGSYSDFYIYEKS
ncbi:MAG: class I SAM-dependent methyltransferase [Sedimenticola sp.]|nr:class I SAM-dependent methyltransferase [Sedimenticola sp.]